MKIEKFTKLKDNRYKILFDDENVITLYDDVIVKYNLLFNKEMDKKKFDEITNYNDELDSYYKAIKYINRKLRTKKEIKKYLEKEFDKKVIDKTIAKLYKDGYLNDKVYLSAYINDQLNLTLNGPYKILKDLSFLGLNEDDIKENLDKIEESVWTSRVEKYITKKIKSNHTNSANKLKEKLIYDLGNIGYKKDMVNLVLEEIEFPIDYNLIIKEGNKIYNKLIKKYENDQLIYHLRNKLYQKGFSSSEIEYYLDNKKTDF